MGFDGITVNFSSWYWFAKLPTEQMALVIFALGGWLLCYYFVFKTGAEQWAEFRKLTRGMVGWKWVLLAVDIPDLFIQTPKAVEQIFAHLSGTHLHETVIGKFWHGDTQRWFSFEIVSIEGYIQFLIRTEEQYRDLVEAAIYAQYTSAEITEVEDYVGYIPAKYPNETHDMRGVEFKLANKDAFPIRTYPHFEYNLSKDAVFSDPMAAILENFTRIGAGENLWMQIIIEPTDSSWKEAGIAIVKEMMGEEAHHKAGLASIATGLPSLILKEVMNIWNWNFEGGHEEHGEEKKKDITKLSPGTKTTIEAIEEKISRVGFKTKVRVLYGATKASFRPTRCVDGFIGSLKQFEIQSANGLVPYKTTHEHYDNKRHTKSIRLMNGFMKVFINRKIKWKLQGAYILNIEELATLWHFPLPFVKAPLVSKAGAKRGEPPVNLPVESVYSPLLKRTGAAAPPPPPSPSAPEELPYG